MPPKTSSAPDIQDLLETIISRLQSMEENQSVLANQMANQVARIEQISETTSSPAVTAPLATGDNSDSLPVDPKLKVSLPEKFDGNPAHYEVFISALDNYFTLKGTAYSNQEIKVRTVGTLLSNHALQWFGTLIKEGSGLLKDFGRFMDELKRLFSDPNAKTKSQILLKKLKQGTGSVIHYSARFRTMVVDTGYNEEAKMAAFRTGLSDQIKDILATTLADPETLEDLISLAIKIDTRIFDRKMETIVPGGGNRVAAVNSTATGTVAMAMSTTGDNHGSATRTSYGTSSASQNGSNSPKGRKKISNLERQRRIQNNLCLYCGENGHIHSGCPKKTNKTNSAGAKSTAVASVAGDPSGSQQ